MKQKTEKPLPGSFKDELSQGQLDSGFSDTIRRQGPGKVELMDDTRDLDYCGGVFSFIVLYTLSVALGAGIMYMLFRAGIVAC